MAKHDKGAPLPTRRTIMAALGTAAAAAPFGGCSSEGDGVDASSMDSAVQSDVTMIDAIRVDAGAEGGVDAAPDAPGIDAGSDAEVSCVLAPEQTAGPFYFDPEMVRRDISEGRPGTRLRCIITVVSVDGGTCTPIPDAVVDLWHCDAIGLYSGYPNQGDGRDVDTTGETFCRGVQIADATGTAEFETVFPGWYVGRTTHLHVKIHVGDRTFVTTQYYFPEAKVDPVYTAEPYLARGSRGTDNADERIPDSHPLVATLDMEAGMLVSRFAVGIAT